MGTGDNDNYSELMSKLSSANSQLKDMENEIMQKKLDLMAEREKNKKRAIYAVIILGICFVIGSFAFLQYQEKKSREAAIEALRQEEIKKEQEFQMLMNNFYETGEKYVQEGDYEKALENFLKIEENAECYNDTQKKIIECENGYVQQTLETAASKIESADYVGAINLVESGLTNYPGNNELQSARAEYIESFLVASKDIVAQYVSEGDYQAAVQALEIVLQYDPNNEEYKELKTEYGKKALLKTVASLEQDYEAIIKTIKESEYADDPEISDAYNNAVALYKQTVLAEVEDIAKSQGYDVAINKLDNVNILIGTDADIQLSIESLKKEKLEEEGFSGSFNASGQTETYEFTTSTGGVYRFEVEDDNANARYRIVISDAYNNEVVNRGISAQNGCKVELQDNTNYTILFKQDSNTSNFKLKIFSPNPTAVINGDDRRISGSITYEGQIDSYLYTPPVSGLYRFDIEDDNAGTQYRLIIKDSRGEEIINRGISHGNGKNSELNSGETYSIQLKQDYDLANYTLILGVPKETVNIQGNTFSGSISYEQQEDNYIYVAPITGKYTFYTDSDNSGARFRLAVYDSRGGEVRDTVIGVSIEKSVELTAGESYKFIVKQDYDFGSYNITIGY